MLWAAFPAIAFAFQAVLEVQKRKDDGTLEKQERHSHIYGYTFLAPFPKGFVAEHIWLALELQLKLLNAQINIFQDVQKISWENSTKFGAVEEIDVPNYRDLKVVPLDWMIVYVWYCASIVPADLKKKERIHAAYEAFCPAL